MAEVMIRDAREGEGEAIREVTLAAYGEYAGKMRRYWEEYRRDIVATVADPAPAEQIVAEEGGRIVGAVLLYPGRWAGAAGRSATTESVGAGGSRTAESGEGGGPAKVRWPEVRLLAVEPGARGRGGGRALVDECARRAREAGWEFLALHTTELMESAVRLYERVGFVRASEIDLEWVPGVVVKGYRLGLGASGSSGTV